LQDDHDGQVERRARWMRDPWLWEVSTWAVWLEEVVERKRKKKGETTTRRERKESSSWTGSVWRDE
jgi:hypothetical protein